MNNCRSRFPMDPLGASKKFAVCLGLLVCAAGLFVRAAISLNSYSGAGKPPMFGDYEAQRHWMEITFALPIAKWYVNSTDNDLQYWGLDYPPLTAYHSWVGGAIAHRLNPDWVALNASRGHESWEHKLYMRYTVLAADVLFYFTAVFAYSCVLYGMQRSAMISQATLILLLLLQPGLVLIDHGHFQYNCISLGLALWGIAAVITQHDILGSVAFSLALNYKQMELYHALPFFCFLLGKALQGERRVQKVVSLGVAVIATFVICWLPFLTSADLTLQVLHRLFPVGRGLYEDKVANVWCTLAPVIKLRQLLSRASLLRLSTATTLLAVLPSSWNLLWNPVPYRFILALVNSSLSFFLFSFQVHEKSLLLASLPVSLLTAHHPLPAIWFSIISTFSMYPLLVKDGLALPCWALCGLFYICSRLLLRGQKTHWALRALFTASLVFLLLLCALSHVVPPPPRLPDLFPVLISGYSCVVLVASFLYFHWLQFGAQGETYQNVSRPINIIVSEKPHTD